MTQFSLSSEKYRMKDKIMVGIKTNLTAVLYMYLDEGVNSSFKLTLPFLL